MTEWERSGNKPCPSWESVLTNKAEKGINPLENNTRKRMCGPDSGRIPIKAAKKIKASLGNPDMIGPKSKFFIKKSMVNMVKNIHKKSLGICFLKIWV